MIKTLNEICKIKSSKRIFENEYVDNGIPFIRGQEVSEKSLGKKGTIYECYISPERYEEIKKLYGVPKKNDILITAVGTIGNLLYIDFDTKFYYKDGNLILLTDYNDSVNPKYLYYYLQSPFFKKQLEYSLIGAVQKALTMIMLKDTFVFIPSIKIQNEIANTLSKLEDKLTLNTKIINEIEAMAKLIYNYWFVQFDFPDENNRPYKSSGGAMIYNKDLKREIPVGWEVKTLNDCVTTIIDKRGVTPKKLGGDWVKNGIIALSAKIVKNNKLLHLDEANQVSKEMFEKWMKEKLQDGDILMTSEAPLGEFYYLVGNTNYCLSQRLFAIRANPAIVTHSYLFNELSEGHGFSQIIGKQSGSTVFGIRQDELRKVLIVVPNLEIQKRFNKIVLPNYRLLRKLESENLKLIALRDYLLPLLMNGQVTITS